MLLPSHRRKDVGKISEALRGRTAPDEAPPKTYVETDEVSWC